MADDKTNRVSHQRLLEVLRYTQKTGVFTWRISPTPRIKVRDRAGSVEKNGYRVIRLFNRRYKAHVLAWFYCHKRWPEGPLDHKYGDRDDNRVFMLRLSTPLLNQQNRRGPQGNSTQRFHGCQVGRRNTPEKAHALYLQAKRKYHPTALSVF
jgi:hypothetical protein